MVRKLSDHELFPTQDHTKWSTDAQEKKGFLDEAGFGGYVHAEADAQSFQNALGPKADDATFYASAVNPTTEPEMKQAVKGIKDVYKANLPAEKVTWSRKMMGKVHTGWDAEIDKDGDTAMRSTMQIPSERGIAHVATGSAAPRPKPKGASKKRPAAEEEEGSSTSGGSAHKKQRK